ncbi:unnamed protein product, partial [Symbiodinium pilosum]
AITMGDLDIATDIATRLQDTAMSTGTMIMVLATPTSTTLRKVKPDANNASAGPLPVMAGQTPATTTRRCESSPTVVQMRL